MAETYSTTTLPFNSIPGSQQHTDVIDFTKTPTRAAARTCKDVTNCSDNENTYSNDLEAICLSTKDDMFLYVIATTKDNKTDEYKFNIIFILDPTSAAPKHKDGESKKIKVVSCIDESSDITKHHHVA
ncbi:Uncharacterized protein Fot_34824 [Forsythia ovata]|uniref:Uncharacterized protein n=1 Tax=Forsythia ovata TaxID=205694 RepID=A0ABD1SJS2_9LAMI